MKKNAVYTTLFILTLTFLFMPLAQKHIFKFEIKKLNGEWNRIEKPKLTFESYKSNDYQKNIEQYLSENFGFRELILRVYNEYLWDLFHKTHVKYIIRGHDGWIFYHDDFSAFRGNFQKRKFADNEKAAATYDKITLNMYKLRGVLNDFGIEFMAFFTPEKCRLYHEYLPESPSDTTTINTVEYFKNNFEKYDIPYLDVTELFEKISDTLPFPLIAPGGAHWNFSCVYAIDSILQLAGELMGTNIAKIRCGELKRYDKEMTKDNIQDFDSEGMLNLIFTRDHSKFELYKADVNYKNDSTCMKPSMLFVGNSYFWRPLDLIDFDSVVSNYRFWYYNNTAYSKGNTAPTKQLNYTDEILQSDCIVTFCNEVQLHEMSFGFVNKALVSLCVPDSIMKRETSRLCSQHNISEQEAVEWIFKNPDNIPELCGNNIPTIRNEKALAKADIINMIENDTTWMQSLEKHAEYREKSLKYITIEEMNNVIDGNTLLKDHDVSECREKFEKVISDLIEGLKNNKKTMDNISRQAKEKGVTNEEAARMSAFWVVNHNEKFYIQKVYSDDNN